MPPTVALRFEEFVKTRGREMSIIRLTEIGEDAYGQPIYQESSHVEKVFLERAGRERDLPPGTLKGGLIRLFMVPWAAIGEEGFDVEIDGARYHIVSLDEREAYLMVEAERKA